jgi:hypothetical protein
MDAGPQRRWQACRWQTLLVAVLGACLFPQRGFSDDVQALDASLTRFRRLVQVEKLADFELRWRDYIEQLHKSPGSSGSLAPVGAADAAAGWPMDRLTVKNGVVHCGLYRGELPDGRIDLYEVIRRPGKQLFFLARPIPPGDVTARHDLSEEDRTRLRDLIDKYKNRQEHETLNKQSLVFGERRDDFGRRLTTYRSEAFDLESTADDDTTRTAVVRIDQRVKAYRKLLPPKVEPERPLRILLLSSKAEYDLYLDRRGLKVANPAFYDARENLVVAVAERGMLLRKRTEAEQHNLAVEQELQREKADLDKILRADSKTFRDLGADKDEIVGTNSQRRLRFAKRQEEVERQLKECKKNNQRKFDELTDQMFRTIHHEAFHAYLANYVYNPATHNVPRWLNEGLAQVFEGGHLESGCLRIDAPDPAKLERLWNDLKRPEALSLIEVFRAQPEAFLGIHRGAAPRGADGPQAGGPPGAAAPAGAASGVLSEAERYYLYSWGLAHFLTFEHRVLGTPALDAFLERR